MAARIGTSALRASWGPGCLSYSDATVVTFPSSVDPAKLSKVHVHPDAAEAWRQLAHVMALHQYPVRRADTGGLVCRKITGGSGYSLHSFGIAGDVNWQTNPYGKKLITDMPMAMVNEIKTKIVLNDGTPVFRWGGDYKSVKDAMHFEVVVSREDMRRIGMRAWKHPEPVAEPEPTVEAIMAYLTENLTDDEQKWLADFTKAMIAAEARPTSFPHVLKGYRLARTAQSDGKTEGEVLRSFLF